MNQEIYEILIEKLAELRKEIGDNKNAEKCVDGIENFVLGARIGTSALEKGGVA